MRKIPPPIARWMVLLLLLCALFEVCHSDRDTCDHDDPLVKKLCRKVDSQEKYQEKWVAANHKAETMFRWFNNNKEWLTASRLPRMMKRLLNRAMALNPSENDDFVDEHPATSSPDPSPAILTAEFESKMEQMAQQLNQMAAQLNQTRAQLRQVQLANRKADVAGSSRTDEVSAIETRVNASLSAHQERLNMHNNMTTESLGKIVATSEQMAVRLATAEKLLETLQNSSSTNCSCPPPPPIPRWAAQIPSSSVDLTKEAADDETGETSSSSSSSTAGLQRFQWDMEREIEQLKLKLQLTAGDLEKSINAIQTHSDNTLRNFSSVYQEGMKTLATVLEDKVSMASTSSYDVITNATLAFGEDLQVLRQAVSSSAAQIQYLVGQDLKTVRGLEELRSGVRRHETNIQLLSTQLGDFKVQVQDQLNSIRNHFSQTVNEFYQKIVERQNAMSYRLSSVVDELSAVKGRVRNIPVPTTAGGTDQGVATDDGNDDDPLFTPPSLDSR